MPTGPCGHLYSNQLTIPGVDTFPLSVDDVDVTRESGPQQIKVKVGTIVDSINSVRVRARVRLYYLERTVYEAIKTFANDDLANYLSTFSGTVTLDLGGETITGGVIKTISPMGSVIEDTDPEVEYINSIELEILANTFSWI